jgi:hypothetical protein
MNPAASTTSLADASAAKAIPAPPVSFFPCKDDLLRIFDNKS